MADSNIEIKVCPPELFDALLDSLSELLHLCVQSGASVNFILPFSLSDAKPWWMTQRASLEDGSTVLLVALMDEGKKAAGCVMMGLAQQPNQPHRADLKKMLVHPEVRRRGIGRVLLQMVEHEALKRDRWLINLDTEVGSSGERLYRAQGYIAVGEIPEFALTNDGKSRVSTLIMYKLLKKPEGGRA